MGLTVFPLSVEAVSIGQTYEGHAIDGPSVPLRTEQVHFVIQDDAEAMSPAIWIGDPLECCVSIVYEFGS